jgi:hypothetical protein
MTDKQYDNRNTGALFVNDKKTEANHPNFRGQAQIVTPSGEVMDFWVSAWVKQGKNGEFLSLSYTAKDAAAGANGGTGSFSKLASGKPSGASGNLPSGGVPELDDTIPF